MKMLQALYGPYRGVKFMPTGGISPSNVKEYLSQPNVIAWRRQLALPRRGHQRGQLGGHHPAGPGVHGFGAGSAELTRGKSAAAIFRSPL